MDPRIRRAQSLHWEIDALLRLGAYGAALRAKRREAAELHERLARDRIAHGDALGWTDLFAAITYWAEVGHGARATALLQFGTPLANDAVAQELSALRAWMADLPMIPSLGEFAAPIPALPQAVAA